MLGECVPLFILGSFHSTYVALGNNKYDELVFVAVGVMLDILYVIDMYFRATKITVFLPDGSELKTKVEIQKHYLQSRTFKWNILATLPIDIIIYVCFPFVRAVDLATCRLLRLIRLKDVPNAANNFFGLLEKMCCVMSNSSLRFIKMLCAILLASHFSVFFYVSRRQTI